MPRRRAELYKSPRLNPGQPQESATDRRSRAEPRSHRGSREMDPVDIGDGMGAEVVAFRPRNRPRNDQPTAHGAYMPTPPVGEPRHCAFCGGAGVHMHLGNLHPGRAPEDFLPPTPCARCNGTGTDPFPKEGRA